MMRTTLAWILAIVSVALLTLGMCSRRTVLWYVATPTDHHFVSATVAVGRLTLDHMYSNDVDAISRIERGLPPTYYSESRVLADEQERERRGQQVSRPFRRRWFSFACGPTSALVMCHADLVPVSRWDHLTVPIWLVAGITGAFPMIWLAFALRRRRRRRQNCCMACGYDLTGNVSGICPECGRTVGAGT